jgi:hypothetical protein
MAERDRKAQERVRIWRENPENRRNDNARRAVARRDEEARSNEQQQNDLNLQQQQQQHRRDRVKNATTALMPALTLDPIALKAEMDSPGNVRKQTFLLLDELFDQFKLSISENDYDFISGDSLVLLWKH